MSSSFVRHSLGQSFPEMLCSLLGKHDLKTLFSQKAGVSREYAGMLPGDIAVKMQQIDAKTSVALQIAHAAEKILSVVDRLDRGEKEIRSAAIELPDSIPPGILGGAIATAFVAQVYAALPDRDPRYLEGFRAQAAVYYQEAAQMFYELNLHYLWNTCGLIAEQTGAKVDRQKVNCAMPWDVAADIAAGKKDTFPGRDLYVAMTQANDRAGRGISAALLRTSPKP